jgi:hypothetical protein
VRGAEALLVYPGCAESQETGEVARGVGCGKSA